MTPITIIVPVHNAGAYIEQCAGSIVPQLNNGSRLILVDDASTDNSNDICRRFAARHPNKVTLLQAGGNGVSAARNMGIAAATTPYIAFCDADDAYAPAALSVLSSALDSNPDIDIAVGTFSHSMPPTVSPQRPHTILDSRTALAQTLFQKKGMHESSWAKVYRRSLFDSTTMFVPGRRYEDLEHTARIYLKARNIAFFKTPVYFYRRNPAGFLAQWSDSRLDALWAVDTIEQTIAQQAPALAKAAQSRKFSAYFNIFALAHKHRHPVETLCRQQITMMKKAIITAPHIRFKNRLGALLACLSMPLCTLATRIIYR